ncbi:MAG: DUF1801 domain-containing protein [Flavobacteriales bacterium]|jgi:hypothetical protein
MAAPKFHSIDELFEYLPEEERSLALALRHEILSCIPNAREYLAYQVPFYKVNSRICFLWPASVPWGKRMTYEGVRLGFTEGYRLNDVWNYLQRDSRKRVYWRDLTDLSERDREIIRALLYEAAELDR